MMWGLAERERVAKQLAAERARLVRLCARLSGQHEVAEDLAQETLLAAWRSLDRLDHLDRLSPWLSGIARNVCLNWSRRHYREQARLIPFESAEGLDDERDPRVLERERDEQAAGDLNARLRLLEEALALLSPDTARLIRAHYLERVPQAALAAQRGISANAVAVRLHRGRRELAHLLTTSFRDGTAGSPLVTAPAAQWHETRLWCRECGERRLQGKLGTADGSDFFALRCPQCSPEPGEVEVSLDLTQPYYANIIGGVRKYKPALNRMETAMSALYRRAIASGNVPCLACGRQAVLTYSTVERARHPGASHLLILRCQACGWESNSSLRGMVLALPEAQLFWRDHPRVRTLPPLEMEYQGAPAILTRVRDFTVAAGLDAIARRDTLELLAVHKADGPGVILPT